MLVQKVSKRSTFHCGLTVPKVSSAVSSSKRVVPCFSQKDEMTAAEAKQLIVDNLRGVPNFPKPGILFWDVTTLLLDAKVFQATIDAFVDRYKDIKIDVVAGALLLYI